MTNEKLREWLEGELGEYDSLDEFLEKQEWELASHKQKMAMKRIAATHYASVYFSGKYKVSEQFVKFNKAGRKYNIKTGRFVRLGE